MNNLFIFVWIPEFGSVFGDVVTNGDNQVGRLNSAHHVVTSLDADGKKRMLIFVRNGSFAHESRDHRDMGLTDKLAEVF